ncbi:MAG: heavy metal translocating P-type ATPase, partial [Spirochaetaceae bacterium]|nr:heavy metal translocating P-type ATPase [Spirochaetaceae bacterium]
MNFTVKHSLPGRIRISYDKSKITRQQAALAQSLLSVQEGMTDVSVNYTTGSFLVFYDIEKLSEKHIKAYFSALSEKYLNNQEMLESIGEPQEQESLLFNLAVMTVMHYVKQLLPLPIRIIMRVYSLAPRILKGAELITSGKIFKSEVLDAAAISMALVNKDIKTAA